MYRKNIFMTMMGNYTEILKNNESAINSNGVAEQKQTIYNNSLQASLNRMKDSWDALYLSAINSEAWKSVVGGISLVINGFTGLTKAIGILPTLLVTVMSSLALFGKFNFANTLIASIGKYRVNLEQLNIEQQFYNNNAMAGGKVGTSLGMMFQALTGKTIAQTVATVGATLATVALNVALTMGLSVAIMAVVSGITKLVNSSANAKQALIDLNAEIKKQQTDYKEITTLAKQYDDLSKSIEDAKKNNQDYTDTQIKLEDVQKKIAGILPETTISLDAQGVAYANNRDVIQEVIDRKKENLLIDSEVLISKQENSINKETESYKNLVEQYNKFVDAKKNNKPIYKDFNGDYTTDKSSKYGDSNELVPLSKGEVISKTKEYNDQIIKLKKDIVSYNDSVNKTNELEGFQKYQLIDINGVVQDFIISTKAKTKTTKDDTLANNDNVKSIESLQKVFSTASTKIADYNKYLKELKDNNHLSGDSMKEILAKYPELLTYIGNEKTLRDKLNGSIKDEEKIQKDNLINILKNEKTYYDTRLKGNADLVNKFKDYYDIDLKNYKSLAEAKNAVDNALLKSLATNWSQYYNTSSKTLTTDYAELSRVLGKGTPEQNAQTQADFDSVRNLVGKYNKATADFNKIQGNFKEANVKGFNLDNNKTGGGVDKTSQQSINDKTDIFQNKMSDINNTLSQSDTAIKSTQDAIKSLFDLGDKSSLEKSLKSQLSLVTEYDNKSKALVKAQTDLNKVGIDLTKIIPKTLTKDELSKYQSSLKGQNVLDLSDTDRQRLTESIFPTKMDFGTGSSATKAKADFDNRRKQFVQYLSDIGTLQTNFDKVATDKLTNKNDKQDALIKTGELQASYLLYGFSKTLESQKSNISLMGNIDTDAEKTKALTITQSIISTLKSEQKSVQAEIDKLNKIISNPTSSADNVTKAKAELKPLLERSKVIPQELVTSQEDRGKQQAEALIAGYNKTIEDNKNAISLIGTPNSDEDRKKILEYTNNITQALKASNKAISDEIAKQQEIINHPYKYNASDRFQAQSIIDNLKPLLVPQQIETVTNVEDSANKSMEIIQIASDKGIKIVEDNIKALDDSLSVLEDKDYKGKNSLLEKKTNELLIAQSQAKDAYDKIVVEADTIITDTEQIQIDTAKDKWNNYTLAIYNNTKAIKDNNFNSLTTSYSNTLKTYDDSISAIKANLDSLSSYTPKNFDAISTAQNQLLTATKLKVTATGGLNDMASALQNTINSLKNSDGTVDNSSETWQKYNNQLQSTYTQIEQNIQAQEDLQKSILQNTENAQLDAVQKLLYNGQTSDEANTVYNDKIKYQKTYIIGQEKALTIQKLQQQIQKDINEANKVQNTSAVTLLQTQLAQVTALGQQSVLTRTTLTDFESQYKIQQDQINLANAQKNRVIQELQKQSDGTYQYNYVADQNAIDTANSQLLSDQLALVIQQQQEQNKVEKDTLDSKNAYYTELGKIISDAESGIISTQAEFNSKIEALNLKYKNNTSLTWTSVLDTITDKKGDFTTGFTTIQTSFTTYTTTMATLSTTLKDTIIANQNAIIASNNALITNLQALALVQAGKGIVPTSNSTTVTKNADGSTTSYVPGVGTTISYAPITTPSSVDAINEAYLQSLLSNNKSNSNPLTLEELKKKLMSGGYQSLDTGGYTSESEGFAMLHKKELILNKIDTSNILKAVDITRQFMQNFKLPEIGTLSKSSNQPTQQIFQIDKLEFPNVESAQEIKDALNSLPRLALQTVKSY